MSSVLAPDFVAFNLETWFCGIRIRKIEHTHDTRLPAYRRLPLPHPPRMPPSRPLRIWASRLLHQLRLLLLHRRLRRQLLVLKRLADQKPGQHRRRRRCRAGGGHPRPPHRPRCIRSRRRRQRVGWQFRRRVRRRRRVVLGPGQSFEGGECAGPAAGLVSVPRFEPDLRVPAVLRRRRRRYASLDCAWPSLDCAWPLYCVCMAVIRLCMAIT